MNHPTTTKKELTLTRILDAPRDLVFKVWTDPVHLARWWGPNGFSNPVCELDLRPGGAIHIDMKDPDGVVFPMGGTVQEVVAPERFVFTATAMHDDQGEPQLETHNTITLEDYNDKTRLTLEVVVLNASEKAALALAGMEQGWTESLERLFTTVDESTREILITRLLNAPRELVFEAWTNPEHLIHWWGPRGFTNTFLEIDVRPGGVWRFIMHGPDGVDYPNLITYEEVVKPERLVYLHTDDTEDAREQFHVTVDFTKIGEKTRLTMRMLFATTAERDFVVREYGAIEGGNQTIDRLEELLQTMV